MISVCFIFCFAFCSHHLAVIDVRQRQILGTFNAHDKHVRALKIVGGQLISGSLNGDVKVFGFFSFETSNFMQIWNLSDFYSVDGSSKLYPTGQLVQVEDTTRKDTSPSVMQILNVDETVYVADITGVRKFRI